MNNTSNISTDHLRREQWLAIRKEAGLKIDADTAEVFWCHGQIFDPYGIGLIDPDLPEDYHQIGLDFFARSPGSDIWVWFGDLPDAVRDALWAKLDRGSRD